MFCSSFSAGATISVMVEIFNQSFRPSAFLIVGCINWMGLFVLGMIFPLIVVSDCNWIAPSRLIHFWMLTRSQIIAINCSNIQSSEVCPNTKPAHESPRPIRGAATGLQPNMASGSSWFDTKHPDLYIEHTFEFWLLRHRLVPKGRERETKFLFSLQWLPFLLAG